MNSLRFAVVALLLASVAVFAPMIPGGVVETRDFSAYSPVILGLFNIFLTILGLGSLVFAYFVLKRQWGYTVTALIGMAYVAVYLLDLGGVFPVSPTPMPRFLTVLEWAGTGIGLAVAVFSVLVVYREKRTPGNARDTSLPFPVVIALVLTAVAIILYATWSAMGL